MHLVDGGETKREREGEKGSGGERERGVNLEAESNGGGCTWTSMYMW